MDKVGPVQDPEQPPVCKTSHFLFAALRSNLHLKTKDFHLVNVVSAMLQRPTRMSFSPPCFWMKETKKQSGPEH